MEIYLDNSATTKMAEEAAEKMLQVIREDYGNPSSLHLKGIGAEGYIREARSNFAGLLKVKEKEIFFTSGGTESDNWAIFSAAKSMKHTGKRLITTAIEHPAVLSPMKELERQGWEVICLPVDKRGIVSEEALAEALNEETALVSVMMVNNEVGSIQPVERIGALIREKAPQTLFHVDAVQGFGKLAITPSKWGIDLMSVSAHKLHGPKGVGLLYASSKSKLKPMIYGGGQQEDLRSGTENVPGIAAIDVAAKLAYANLEEDRARLYELKDHFVSELKQLPDVVINGPAAFEADVDMGSRTDAPHIVNASFTGIRSEVLLHSLEDKGIFVSAGSACSSHKRKPSATLSAMGLSAGEMESALRFSFSSYTTREELDLTLEALRELIPNLRRFTRH